MYKIFNLCTYKVQAFNIPTTMSYVLTLSVRCRSIHILIQSLQTQWRIFFSLFVHIQCTVKTPSWIMNLQILCMKIFLTSCVLWYYRRMSLWPVRSILTPGVQDRKCGTISGRTDSWTLMEVSSSTSPGVTESCVSSGQIGTCVPVLI